nr:isoform 2 of f-box/wd repeat-containing protein 1a [Quercus suber]
MAPHQPNPASTTRDLIDQSSTHPSRGRHAPLDEGYDEDRSQPDSDMLCPDASDTAMHQVLASALDLPTEQRKLPNVDKEKLGLLCEELIHFDPAHYLPNELMLQIFSYLDPVDLLTASSVSRPWRARSQDERLWRLCFAREGWQLDGGKLAALEAREKSTNQDKVSDVDDQAATSALSRSGSRKRPREEAFSESENVTPSNELTSDGDDDDLHSMEGIELNTGAGLLIRTSSRDEPVDFVLRRSSSPSDRITCRTSYGAHPMALQLGPKLWTGTVIEPKLSWPYLYKQRCRLEKNWEAGRYQAFQLPSPQHLDEGHEECVYTIQHTSTWLVSGSRDKTIRRWSLETNRLFGQPLRGHVASVLCLQFDPRPEHDIIVSGGSDSYVIVWRFSTGEIIKKMTNVHTESVLNLRFDDRYIVTCSKDRTIKIWNRRALALDDPVLPAHVLPVAGKLLCGDFIKEYSLLSTLEGHGAAVNAVMIHENTIVSASGDRTIKSWNIDTGKLVRTYTGHSKGIACVQYDGRRIVSGSSDNTVRIFDAEKAAEIACLNGHSNLVRTVQARFGDLDTVTDEELAQQARQVDRAFWTARGSGMQLQRPGRNAGSSRPEVITALGTKIPPGGGGTRWAKIVSGSYDETVLVWKRDRAGNWVKKVTLTQEVLRRSRSRQARPAGPPTHQHVVDAQPQPAPARTRIPPHAERGHQQPPAHATPQHLPAQIQMLPHPGGLNVTAQVDANTANAPVVATAAIVNQVPVGGVPHHHHAMAPLSVSNRIFKLQFDARRVIACSQNRVIVGWDFACGDPELQRIGDWSVETF